MAAARAAAAAAVEREPKEWRAWVVLSRLQAKLGEAAAALASYRKAQMLNPDSLLFQMTDARTRSRHARGRARRLVGVGERLEPDRPIPGRGFRGDLRRALLAAAGPGQPRRAGRWRLLVAAYSGLGALLLAVAAIGLAGVGPFAA